MKTFFVLLFITIVLLPFPWRNPFYWKKRKPERERLEALGILGKFEKPVFFGDSELKEHIAEETRDHRRRLIHETLSRSIHRCNSALYKDDTAGFRNRNLSPKKVRSRW